MTHTERFAIVDEMIKLLLQLEGITFPTAGELFAASPPDATSNNYSSTAPPPTVRIFDGSDGGETITDPKALHDRAGPDLKTLLASLLEKWIQDEYDRGQHELSCSLTPRFRALLAMLDDLGTEGVVFRTRNSPIVLQHWDLEPRNLIVSNAKTDDDNNNNNPHGAWKIT
ncbi:MAG: hypothetical protein Q9228_005293, partial [Teloschistes exilis]